MSDVQTTEFLRLIKVTFDISLDVLQAYTSAKLIKPLYGESFIRFLDKKKHSFFHKWQSNVPCCNCSTFISQKKEMADWIFHKLYVITPGIKCDRRNNPRGQHGVIKQHCLCKIISQQNISLTDLDVSAICFLLKNCGSSNLLIKEIDDIAKQRTTLCHAAKGTKSFTKTDYEGMWIILEQSILSLAKEIDDFYYRSVKGHLATIKKYDVDKADVIHHLNDIKEDNEKMKQDTTDYFQDTKNSILLAQEDLIAKGEKQSSEIQKKITETEANLLEGQQEILGDVKGLNTAFQNNASEIDKRLEDRTQPMHADVKKTNQKLNKITRKQIKQDTKMEKMSSVLESMFYAQHGEIKTISEIRRHFQSHQTTPQEDMDPKRKRHEVVLEIKTPSSWSKDNINEKLEERLKKKEENIEDDIELVKFEFKCLLLTTRVSEKLINDKQALVAAIGAFLKSIFDDCGIDTSIPETVFIIIDIYCSLRSGLTRKLEDNDEQKDSDNDEEKEWETSSVDCQEPELKKRKTYQEDLTEDSEISFDINETLKKLGKLKLIGFKINEGEKQRRKLQRRYGGGKHEKIFLNKIDSLLSSLRRRGKSSMAANSISPDNLLQKLSYQRKQNAAGTKEFDFLDMNFGLQCNFCQTQNEDDILGICIICREFLCNKCLVQHHVDHIDHSYDFVDKIVHGYKRTSDSISVEDVVADIKCLTIDTLVIANMNRFHKDLKLSIYDLTGKHLTTKQTGYTGISDAQIAVIDPTTMAVSIPPDAVLIANYNKIIINIKEIKINSGMTGGITSINNMLYLAYETGIKVLTLTGQELASIDIPDITLLYPVSIYRLLCVYNRKCGQRKTMGYIDITNNSLLPLDKLPFHPSSVTVDNGGNILFVEDGIVWQAKSDGSDCRVIISRTKGGLFEENYERVCFNAHSNLLIVAGRYRSISVFRKVEVGDK